MSKLTPGELVKMRPSTRLNIVFDIDHTLIFTIDKNLHPRLDMHPDFKDRKNVYSISIPTGPNTGFQMWLVLRYGVIEMLDYLSTFCDFFVYSHGFHDYITIIL